MTIIDTITDAALFKPLFRDLSTWANWLTVLRAVFALPMTDAERILFTQLSDRETPPTTPVEEAWLLVGRRGGKSRIAALIAVYLSCFRDYTAVRAPGERITIMVIACDRRQARTIFRYALALLEQVPMLRDLILRQDQESIDLSNSVTIEITTNNFRSLRGYTVGAAVLDEVAYWRDDDSSSPDVEVVGALRPSMATIPGALLVGIGSTYRRAGVLYEAWKRHFGQEGDSTLVIQASSQLMNPCIPDSVIARAMELDPVAARSEYFAEFRDDLSSFLDRELIEQAIEPGVRERAPQGDLTYLAFFDAATGERARRDSITMAVAHRERHRVPRSYQEEQDQRRQAPRAVLDVIRGVQPPFNPVTVIKEFCTVLKAYHLSSVTGDRFAAGFVRDAFNTQGIRYIPSELTKSEIYLEALPLFTAGSVRLLDVPRLTKELLQLERRTARSGRDTVDHGAGLRSHDDWSNSACGALALCTAHVPTVHMQKLIGF